MKPNQKSENGPSNLAQFSTFKIADHLYGIDVTRVQEIVRPMPTTKVPLAQEFVRGLINLRGQVATAIELRKLLNIREDAPNDSMNVVCESEGNLISFLVDEIGDVIEVSDVDFEKTPSTIPRQVSELLSGVYKTNEFLLSIIDVDQVMLKLNA